MTAQARNSNQKAPESHLLPYSIATGIGILLASLASYFVFYLPHSLGAQTLPILWGGFLVTALFVLPIISYAGYILFQQSKKGDNSEPQNSEVKSEANIQTNVRVWNHPRPEIFYENLKTLVGQPVREINYYNLFVTSDNYAFDINNLMGYFIENGCQLINPYTHKCFSNQDIHRILNYAYHHGLLGEFLNHSNVFNDRWQRQSEPELTHHDLATLDKPTPLFVNRFNRMMGDMFRSPVDFFQKINTVHQLPATRRPQYTETDLEGLVNDTDACDLLPIRQTFEKGKLFISEKKHGFNVDNLAKSAKVSGRLFNLWTNEEFSLADIQKLKSYHELDEYFESSRTALKQIRRLFW